ncbi:MAG: hypothetical protein V3V08_14710, partial [Nannocystaceae bacterium]
MTLLDALAQLKEKDAQLKERIFELLQRVCENDALKTERSAQKMLIEKLSEQVAKLTERLGQNSANSHALLGVQISLGALSSVEARVSEALNPAYDEVWAEVQKGEVKYTDGTTWLQSGCLLTLWTIATAVGTVFKVLANGTKKTLEP